jgi:hypothetical protein
MSFYLELMKAGRAVTGKMKKCGESVSHCTEEADAEKK